VARGGGALAAPQDIDNKQHDSFSTNIFNLIVERTDDVTLLLMLPRLLIALH
jgi:hypothetical protein